MRRSIRRACRCAARGLALAGALDVSAACAAELLPAHPPVPAQKPSAGEAAPASKPAEPNPPVPVKRPAVPTEETSSGSSMQPGEAGKARNESAKWPAGEAPEPKPVPVPGLDEDGAALAACYRTLDAMGVDYIKKGTVNDPGRCGMEAPIVVMRILPGVALEPSAEMRCATAVALARWTKRVVEPAAEALGDGVHLTALSQGSAYVCKHRDSDPDRKISQHAFGDAIDIVTFRFDGHTPLPIAPRRRSGRIEEGFQRAVIGGACLYFTTVLGPRADSFHRDNLHLDIERRSHGFRLCQ